MTGGNPDRASFIRQPPCLALRGSLVYNLHRSNEAAYRHSQQDLIQAFITGPFQTLQ